MTIAIDISQFTGEVTVAQFREARTQGCTRVVVALNNIPLAVRQIQNAVAVGLEVEAYIYYYFAQNVADRTRNCLAAIAGLPVTRVWIDCEDEQHTLEGKYLAGRIRVARDLVRQSGYQTGIYTAAWWWGKHMAGITEFSGMALWDARWDRDPDIDAPTYGGWTQAEMSQHTNDTHFAGIWCDINSYRGPLPPEAVPTEHPALGHIKVARAALDAAEAALRG